MKSVAMVRGSVKKSHGLAAWYPVLHLSLMLSF